MQARFYAPWYGRFLSPDPARDQHFEETQSWNIYSYVQNNRTMMVDPDGMRGFWSGVWAGVKESPGNWARSWGSAFKQDSTMSGYGHRIARQALLGPAGTQILGAVQKGVSLTREATSEYKTNGAFGLGKIAGREGGTEAINLAVTAGIAKGIGAATGGGITNPVPSTMARVIPEGVPATTLGKPGVPDVFVTAASDISGMNAAQLSQRLTIPSSANGFQVIEFSTPKSGVASPVFRPDPGFVGGGKTAGGAREFVIPNQPVPADATIRKVH